MLTIAKLRGGSAGSVDYYLGVVAAGIEDYYAGHGEAPGRWLGSAANDLGLTGTVDGDELRRVLEGHLPGVRPLAGADRERRTPGWDLTWSAPKSVSVLFGMSDAATSAEVVAAHEVAVEAGLDYLARWALVTRRRVDGSIAFEPGDGFVAAGFRHRTSRALDPQLHTHTLVANAVRRSDGAWGAIDSRVLYRHAKTAGFVYQAVLRSELTRRLGVEWGSISRGVGEATTVPKAVRELFSTRRSEIEAELDARGASSISARRVVALRTRTAKRSVAGTDVLRKRWRAQLREARLSIGPVNPPAVTSNWPESRFDASVLAELAGPDGLTKERTSFGRPDVVREWAERVDPRSHVTVDALDRLVAATLADDRFVTLRPTEKFGVADTRRFSTRELMSRERAILETAVNGREASVAVVPGGIVEDLIRGRELSDEQAAMVRTLTMGGHRIDGVIGVAGAGKTYGLGAAAAAWAAAGWSVIGMAT